MFVCLAPRGNSVHKRSKRNPNPLNLLFSAQNVTVEEIISSYKQACQKLNCKPVPKVLKQIQVRPILTQPAQLKFTSEILYVFSFFLSCIFPVVGKGINKCPLLRKCWNTENNVKEKVMNEKFHLNLKWCHLLWTSLTPLVSLGRKESHHNSNPLNSCFLPLFSQV